MIMTRVLHHLDRLAVWWLDRHCRAWQANRHATARAPACHTRIYGTWTELP